MEKMEDEELEGKVELVDSVGVGAGVGSCLVVDESASKPTSSILTVAVMALG